MRTEARKADGRAVRRERRVIGRLSHYGRNEGSMTKLTVGIASVPKCWALISLHCGLVAIRLQNADASNPPYRIVAPAMIFIQRLADTSSTAYGANSRAIGLEPLENVAK